MPTLKNTAASKRVAVLLGGCGHRDGSEIHESAYAILALSKAGAEPVFFAPDLPIPVVIDHLTGKKVDEKRNMLTESARIARGKIAPLSQANPDELDALIIPGGGGLATNFSDWATKGAQSRLIPAVEEFVLAMFNRKKPIGAICIAPALLSPLFGPHKVQMTVGYNKQTNQQISETGVCPVGCGAGEIIVDRKNLICSTPAFMEGQEGFATIYSGIERLVFTVLELIS